LQYLAVTRCISFSKQHWGLKMFCCSEQHSDHLEIPLAKTTMLNWLALDLGVMCGAEHGITLKQNEKLALLG